MWRRCSMLKWFSALVFAIFVLAPSVSFSAVELPTDAPPKQPHGIGDEPQRRAEKMANLKEVVGELAGVDLAAGKVTLREIKNGRETNEYAVNERDTTVTDPLDKQFLKLEDLQVGYLVTIEYAKVDERRLARTITVESVTDMRWVVGQITTIDPADNAFFLTHTRPGWVSPVVTHYHVDPQVTQVIDLRGQRFMSLGDLRAGDVVQVEYTLREGERLAHLVTIEPPSVEVFWASGLVESVDFSSGTIVVSERIPRWNFSESVYYVVDMDNTRVVDLRGRSFRTLQDLRPGDPVSLQFVVVDGKRSVHLVLLEPTGR